MMTSILLHASQAPQGRQFTWSKLTIDSTALQTDAALHDQYMRGLLYSLLWLQHHQVAMPCILPNLLLHMPCLGPN